MKQIPCLMCLDTFESSEDKAIAIICKDCNKGENINKYLKNLNYKSVKAALTAIELNKVKKVYTTVSNKDVTINEYGEII